MDIKYLLGDMLNGQNSVSVTSGSMAQNRHTVTFDGAGYVSYYIQSGGDISYTIESDGGVALAYVSQGYNLYFEIRAHKSFNSSNVKIEINGVRYAYGTSFSVLNITSNLVIKFVVVTPAFAEISFDSVISDLNAEFENYAAEEALEVILFEELDIIAE